MKQEEVTKVMSDPVAQELLHSSIPARLAYTGRDGFPRAIPVGFYWDGANLQVFTPPNSAKFPALQKNPRVALTLDTETFPPKVLLLRGTASTEVVDGVPDEYLTASWKVVPEEQREAFETEVRSLYQQMVRITIVPEWAKILDFETRAPRAVMELAEQREERRAAE